MTNVTIPGAAITATFNLPTTDGLYFAQGSQLSQWAAAPTDLSLAWTSKEHVFPKPLNLGAAFALVTPGTVMTIRFTCDGIVRHTKVVSASGYFRLPAGFKAQRWVLDITGTGTLRELYLAETMRELATA
jgi:hypothetical protein